MTVFDYINPECWQLIGLRFNNNPIAFDSPDLNPKEWGEPKHNPQGEMPKLNPEHYIHPLTGRYSTGCLDFGGIVR